MSIATLFDEALLATLDAEFAATHPGVVLAGMPTELTGWLPRLLATLADDDRYYVSVAGADAATKATLPQPNGLRFDLGATHAVAVRNALDLPPTARRVVVMLRPEARLQSLRQRNYVTISPANVVRQLALRQAATGIPAPQQHMWQSLAEGHPPVALLAFLNFYQAVTRPNDPPNPRAELHRLDLLPDPSLFDHPATARSIRTRLAENADLTQRLLLGDPADEETAYKQYRAATTLDTALAERLRAAAATFRAMDPAAPLPPQLQTLDVALVRQLLGGPLPKAAPAGAPPASPTVPLVPDPDPLDPADDDNQAGEGERPDYGEEAADDSDDFTNPTDTFGPVPTGGRSGDASGNRLGTSFKKKYTAGLDNALVHLAAGDVPGVTSTWQHTAGKLLAQLRKRLDKTPDESKPLEADRVQVLHRTNALALALTNGLLGAERLGGVLALPHIPNVEEALASLPADQLPPAAPALDAPWLAELRRYLRTADGLVPGLTSETALHTYLAAREALLPHAALLTSAPLSAVLLDEELREAIGQAIVAYNQLLGTVARHYADLQRHNSAGQRIAGLLLCLDVVEVRAGTAHRAALLTPLHPLVLWKYLELLPSLLAGPEQARELLEVLGQYGLLREPLRALVLPAEANFPTVALAQAGHLGASWPVYRPTGLVRVTVEEKLLVEAARKLAVLYPPVRRCLRLFVYHPDNLESVAEALEQLRLRHKEDGVQFERFQLLIGHLPGRPVPLAPLDGLLDNGLLTLETRPVERTDEVSEWLRDQPVHLLVLAGQRHLHPLPIGREATHLHPLSLPQVLEYDQFNPRSPLVLRPRGQQPDPAQSALAQPFASFHTLAAEVAGQPGREWSGTLTKPAPDGTQPALLPLTVLLLLSAELPTPTEPDRVLVLARQGGLSGDTVLTRWNKRYVAGVRAAVLSELNYQFNDQGATKLLRRLEATGHTNLLRAISGSSKAKQGFLPTELSGQLGQAVALRWYEDEAANPFHLTISCDSVLASHWLAQRETGLRPDLLGLRRLPNGQLSLDVIEVKSHEIVGDLDAPGQPGPQLRAAARALLPIITQTGGNLLTDCRRELLREQIFHEGQLSLPPGVQPAEWAAWVTQISTALDGQAPPEINLLLIEIIKGKNFDQTESPVPGNPNGPTIAEQASIRRIKLGEKNIQAYLNDVPPAGPPPAASPGTPLDTVPPAPASGPVFPPAPVATRPEPAPQPVADSSGAPVIDSLPLAQVLPPVPASPAPLTIPPPARPAALARMAGDLYATLQDFNITPARPIDPNKADVGPSLIRFKVELARGQRGGAVQSLASDIQRGMQLHYLPRIENLAGTGFLSVEIPRPDPQPVPLLPVLAREAAQPIHPAGSFPAGLSPDGTERWLTIADLPHMLVGGTTNSGKSMFLNSLIVSLSKLQPATRLKLVLVDPKGAEFSFFEQLPHLLTEIIHEPGPAIQALSSLMNEEYIRRRDLLRQYQCLNIRDYHKVQPSESMPLIVVIIDELETFLEAMNKGDRAIFENLLGSIARLTRYVGIHLVVATQRPDKKVIYGNLKNNLDCRVAFRLASNVDSRVILKEGGAEDLMGAGDMLLQVGGRIQRLQGFYLPTEDLRLL
ncbi:DNA translocase FtsK [Hymenobacter aquaticus]|uniref:DNA translocase FtsK n=1 Tax=Hymenobacter aquaticus TaxID=1867101 RepID=A0A4Z0Q8G1_9BACT|nr:DNA translocase FtsK [Hymenobacter aquaticus]TGE25964.1 DNA translocase FtsK [Hymenobacter aquaticus]